MVCLWTLQLKVSTVPRNIVKACAHCGCENEDAASECKACHNAGFNLIAAPQAELGAKQLVSPGDPVDARIPPAIEGVASTQPPPLPLVQGVPAATACYAWSERRWRLFEVSLVCVVAFGSSILRSGEILFTGELGASYAGALKWIYPSIHELGALALLWYVLHRRMLSFASLGLRWTRKDAVFGPLLWLLGSVTYSISTPAISSLFAAYLPGQNTHPDVANYLFGGSVTVLCIVFQLINPFFEELIVRAYLMTELKHLTGSMAVAVVGSVAVQISYHFYQGAPAALSHAGMFLLFSLYYAKTNRIFAPILAHLLTDLTATLYYALKIGHGG